MGVTVQLVGGLDSVPVKVSGAGELVVGPVAYDSVATVEANVINTAFSLIVPSTRQFIVVTGFSVYANKAVGAGDAAVEIYTANAVDSTTVIDSVFLTEVPKTTSREFLPLNLLVAEGVWVNIKTDDATVFVAVTYHYLEMV